MNNHYHVVLRVNVEQAKSWSKKEVVKRWHSLFTGNLLSHQFLSGCRLDSTRLAVLTKDIEIWRARLCDISWLMRIVNEAIARQANQEDGCTGRFWEGRFKSQALLDERALLACMAYVDLNPVRASIAQSPETSEFTSVKQRIDSLRNTATPPKALVSFTGGDQQQNGLPFKLTDYLELVDWTGRVLREDKRGAINASLPPILQRLSLESDAWRLLTTTFESQFKQWVGSEHIVRQIYSDKHYQRFPSTSAHKALFG